MKKVIPSLLLLFVLSISWANMNQGQMDWGDKNLRQFYEGWPSGKSNHYWFDLNRDYLLLENPESKGRVAKLHEWKSNVVTDHHESSGEKYSEPVKFDTMPYISGWISEENLERIKGPPVVSVYSEGRGKVISYHEDMNFRGIWMGTHKLFTNSIFFGGVIR